MASITRVLSLFAFVFGQANYRYPSHEHIGSLR
jgi:hypothetical protein